MHLASLFAGFSFGGVLAQMVAAQLWLLPHTRTDQLMSNVICITFGQPLIQSLLLTHVAESYPDFKNSIHAIGLKNDNLPTIMEKIDSLTVTKEVGIEIWLSVTYHCLIFIRLHSSLSWRIYNAYKSSIGVKNSCP